MQNVFFKIVPAVNVTLKNYAHEIVLLCRQVLCVYVYVDLCALSKQLMVSVWNRFAVVTKIKYVAFFKFDRL